MFEKSIGVISKFLMKAICGLGIIILVNGVLESKGISAQVGVNLISFTISGMLGGPGLMLLYGISLY